MAAQTWLITGASAGMGKALAEQGDRVVLAARTLRAMTPLVERHPQAALAVELDVTDPRQRVAAVEAAETRFGAIDVLVDNAANGFYSASKFALEGLTEALWQEIEDYAATSGAFRATVQTLVPDRSVAPVL